MKIGEKDYLLNERLI